MNIKEIYNNKTVKKIKMKCDNYKTDIDGKFMIPRNGFYIISGSAGSGKTNLLISLLSEKKMTYSMENLITSTTLVPQFTHLVEI